MIVTDVGGLAEIVPDGRVGCVCPPSAEGVADAIERIYAPGRKDTGLGLLPDILDTEHRPVSGAAAHRQGTRRDGRLHEADGFVVGCVGPASARGAHRRQEADCRRRVLYFARALFEADCRARIGLTVLTHRTMDKSPGGGVSTVWLLPGKSREGYCRVKVRTITARSTSRFSPPPAASTPPAPCTSRMIRDRYR